MSAPEEAALLLGLLKVLPPWGGRCRAGPSLPRIPGTDATGNSSWGLSMGEPHVNSDTVPTGTC